MIPLIIAAGALLPDAYQFLIFHDSEDFRLKALMPQLPPPLLDVLLSYGLLVVLAIYGAVVSWPNRRLRLITLWALVTFVMIYAPVIWSRRMIEGIHLPLCLLAAIGLVHLARRVPSSVARATVIGGVAGVMCLSTVVFIQKSLAQAANNNFSNQTHTLWSSAAYRRSVRDVFGRQRNRTASARGSGQLAVSDIWEGFRQPLYLTAGDAAALRFIGDHAANDPSRAVLCFSMLGNYVPRETGLHVFVGHGNHTLYFPRKARQTLDFYSGDMPPQQALTWLHENRIGYIIEGYYERALPPATLPSRRLRLPKLFERDGTAVYAVP
jgi:hypothetical protein